MKQLFLLSILIIGLSAKSQDLPAEPANGYAFPMGSKFTIKMHPTDSVHYNYSIIEYEPFQEIVDTWENDSLFSKEGKKGTIEFYFCMGTSGKTEAEREKNMKVLLLMKNHTEYSFDYTSDIQTQKNGEFKKTSNVGTHPGAKGTEMWPYMIYQIALNDFRISK